MARLNNSVVYHLLGSYGFTGTFNDRLFKYLGSLGFTGTLSDRLYKYLGSLGLTGSMSDRLKKWDGVFPPVWGPSDLFSPGQPGFWAGGFAPTSLRLFQDAAGTIPANQAGQPVGKVVRAAGTVDASQATALSRPTLARWPKGGRRNLLNNTAFAGAVSGTPGTVPTGWNSHSSGGSLEVLPNGELRFSVVAGRQIMGQTFPMAAGEQRSWSLRVIDNPDGVFFNQLFTTINPGGTAVEGKANGVLVAPQTYVPLAGDLLSFHITAIDEAPSPTFRIGVGASSATTGSATLAEPSMEVGLVTTPYQKVASQYDVTEMGVPDVWHLWNDGGDSLPAVLPSGSYEIAWVTHLGAVSYASVTSDGTAGTNLLRAERMADVLAREGVFTASEKTALEAYWQQRYAA